MMRTLLLVDDIKGNREILKKILGSDYAYLEAENGQEALKVLMDNQMRISAMLLDLSMPVMTGYEVLKRIQGNAAIAKLPTIVMTGDADAESEVRALSLGAVDYISKPYNPAIIRQRVRNTISLHENAATVNALQRDRLTGLYNREAFFDRIPALIQSRAPGSFIMSAFDIDNFKVVNDQYGTEEGDRILRHIGEIVKADISSAGGLCSRLNGDNFAAVYPVEMLNGNYDFLSKMRDNLSRYQDMRARVSFSVGRYRIADLSLSPGSIYDRAYIAKQSVKGRYDVHVAYYDESMRDDIVKEQRIISEMDAAISEKQFEVWYQPQFNHSSGALIGAEALVRWNHPERGIVPPGEFIPVFEQNGFIYELDKYVWEETCRRLREWIDQGRRPLPVSVNISRYDVFRPDIVEVICGLLEKYGLPVELLRLEITESAFAKFTEQIVSVVKTFIDRGFTVEIDDFGSGYSSLNTLKDVPAQVVKLDMRFLENDDHSQRGGSILESIVRMIKWLGMSVIAEGVENVEQANFLKSIGCSYVQGYLYAKPMPRTEYEALAGSAGKEERLIALETVENLDNNTFWNPESMDTLIFNSYVGSACIFEYHGGKIDLLRANDKFARIFGGDAMSVEDTLKLDWLGSLTEESRTLVKKVLRQSYESREEITAEYIFSEIPGIEGRTYLRSTMRVIASAGERWLVYCSSENITAQRQAEQGERQIARQLQVVMNEVNCGITAVTLGETGVTYLLANDRYFQMLGYTREQYFAEVRDAYTVIHPEDRQRVKTAVHRISQTGKPGMLEYRAVRRDGAVIWLRNSISMTSFEEVEGPVQLSIFTDFTAEKNARQDLLDNLPGGAALYEYDRGTLAALHINKRYWELVGRTAPEYETLSVLNAVHPEDQKNMYAALEEAIRQRRDVVCDLRVLCGNAGEYRPFQVRGRILPQGEEKYYIYTSYTPISDETMSIREMLPVALAAMMDSSADYSYVKDKDLRYICCSHTFTILTGLEHDGDVVGKTDYELFDASIADAYTATDMRLLGDGKSIVDFVEPLPPDGDGTPRYASTSKYLLKDSYGEVIGLYGMSRDVTRARKTDSQLKLLTDTIPGGIATYLLHADRVKNTYFNEGFCKMFECTRQEYELIGARNPLAGIFPEDVPAVMEALDKLYRQGTPMDVVFRVRLRSGRYKWINFKGVISEREKDTAMMNAVLLDVTERQESMERLRLSEEENRLAVRHSGNTICRYDVDARTLTAPEDLNPIYHLPQKIKDVPEGQVREGQISPETAAAYTQFYRDIQQGRESGTAVYQRKSDQGWRWLKANYSTLFSSEGRPVSAVISFQDATDQMEKEAVFKKWQQSLQDRSTDTYTLFRCNLSKNSSFDSVEGNLLRVKFSDAVVSFDERTKEYVEQCVYEEDRQRYAAFLNSDTMLASYYRGKRAESIDFRERLPEGGVRWLRLTVDLVEYPNSTDVEVYLMYEDIDRQKRAELLTIERAQTDPLTRILNRSTFIVQAERVMQASRPGSMHALLMLDIDGFKLVNDVFGHAAGDEELIEVADLLRTALRRGDLVGRLGGDEFVILLADIPNDTVAANKARQLCALTRKAFSMEVQVSGSIGIVICPRDGTDFDTLYKKADAALYHVKGSGKDNFAFYHDDMGDEHLVLPPSPVDAAEGKPREKKRRMLIVDDSKIDYAMMAHIFVEDFVIEKAKDGNSALIRLRHYGSAISVVLLDLMMPGMDGFAVLEKMQSSMELRNIPVIVVSSAEDRDTSLRAIRSGASDFVLKPVDPDLLRIRVRSAISKAENERLRAQNSFLEFQNTEVTRYKTALERNRLIVVEYNWVNGEFIYDPSISTYIAGVYDSRTLWHILLSDLVTDTLTVKNMQETVHRIAERKYDAEEAITVRLKTPGKTYRWFRMTVYNMVDEFALTDKILMVFQDLGPNPPQGSAS